MTTKITRAQPQTTPKTIRHIHTSCMYIRLYPHMSHQVGLFDDIRRRRRRYICSSDMIYTDWP